MVEYKLPREISGKDLIVKMAEVSQLFDYQFENEALRDTWPNVASLSWKLLGSAFSCNARYQGVHFDELQENIRNIRICDIQAKTKFKNGEVTSSMCSEILWTTEAFIDTKKKYDKLVLSLYKGNGLYYKSGARFIHVARDKPLKPQKMYLIKPSIDGLIVELKKKIIC